MLSESHTAKSPESPDIYEHLGRIVDKIVTEKPRDALGAIEVISRLIKETGTEGRPAATPATEEELAARAGYSAQVLTLDKDFLNKEEVDGKMQYTADAKACACAVPDYMLDADLLAWAGVGFGDLESYKIMCSIRNLSTRDDVADKGYKSMRFWGKILGVEKDYYVVEAERDAQPAEADYMKEGDDFTDQKLEGSFPDPKSLLYSFFAYYVTTNLCEPWALLPEAKPREIKVAREVKKLFTGDLKAPIITHPYFAGKEENLLRAQIALISADTVLEVKGKYVFPPPSDDPERDHLTRPTEEDKENFKWPVGEALLKPEAWVHVQPHIHMSGLTMNEPPEADPPEPGTDAEQKYLELVAIHEEDPKRDLMRSIADDKLNWTTKQVGDTSLYRPPYGDKVEDETKRKGNWSAVTTYIRSFTWPGAVCVSRGNQLINLYVGYGLMSGAPDFYYRAPLDIQDEPDEADAEEHIEPAGELEPKKDDDVKDDDQ